MRCKDEESLCLVLFEGFVISDDSVFVDREQIQFRALWMQQFLARGYFTVTGDSEFLLLSCSIKLFQCFSFLLGGAKGTWL